MEIAANTALVGVHAGNLTLTYFDGYRSVRTVATQFHARLERHGRAWRRLSRSRNDPDTMDLGRPVGRLRQGHPRQIRLPPRVHDVAPDKEEPFLRLHRHRQVPASRSHLDHVARLHKS